MPRKPLNYLDDFFFVALKLALCIPMEKLWKAIALIEKILYSKKVTIKTMQQICGLLNFLGRAIVPGIAFTRRLYSYTGKNIPSTTSQHNKGAHFSLQSYHHIRINKEIKADLRMWQTFLKHPSAFSHPFMDYLQVIQANEIYFYTDSSGNCELGCGEICESSWFAQGCNKQFIIIKEKPSIEYLELYAVAAGILL